MTAKLDYKYIYLLKDEATKTGYHLNGKEIDLKRKPGRPRIIRNPLFYPQEKKVEVCSLYCVLGDTKKVSVISEVPESTIKEWKKETWWAEITKEIMIEQNDGLLSTINETINNAMVMLQDRILNGDYHYVEAKYNKEGACVQEEGLKREPIKARDLSQIFSHLTHQRNLMKGDPTQITAPTSTNQRLEELKNYFISFTKGTVLDGECKEIEDKK